MESEKLKIIIETKEEGTSKIVCLIIEELDKLSIELTSSNVDDIEKLFNLVFYKIIKDRKLIEFYLEDNSTTSLFKEVAEDIIIQFNAEIKQSESDFEKIIDLTKK